MFVLSICESCGWDIIKGVKRYGYTFNRRFWIFRKRIFIYNLSKFMNVYRGKCGTTVEETHIQLSPFLFIYCPFLFIGFHPSFTFDPSFVSFLYIHLETDLGSTKEKNLKSKCVKLKCDLCRLYRLCFLPLSLNKLHVRPSFITVRKDSFKYS